MVKKCRIQINGSRAKKFGSTGFRGGYRVIEYKPNFGGRKEHGMFKTKEEAKKFARKLKKSC